MTDADAKLEEDDLRDKPAFWHRWIGAARKAAKEHWEDTRDAMREYHNDGRSEEPKQAGTGERVVRRTYPAYRTSCKVIEPALYARKPTLLAKREFDIEDPIAVLAGTIVERLGNRVTKGSGFDDTMLSAVQDFIHGDKATTQVIYEATITDEPTRIALVATEGPEGMSFFDESEEPYDGEVMQDEEGYFYDGTAQAIADQNVYVAPVCYDEVLHTPTAKVESEITDKAYYFRLEYDEVLEKFPDIKDVGALPWKRAKSETDETKSEQPDNDTPGKFLEGWECWCKKTKKVYRVLEGHNSFLGEAREDPYGLEGFFPSPSFIIGSKPSKSLYPRPEWVHLRPTADQLHLMYNRVFDLIEAVRRRALVDGSNTELIAALNDLSSGEFIGVENFQALVEKGGLQNLVQYIPVAELTTAISELSQLDDKFKANFYEWRRIPDIMRGAGDPVETATAQEIQQGNSQDSFKFTKRQVQQLARDTIEMAVDLCLKVYSDEKIAQICGFQFMSPEDQSVFGPALEMVKNDSERLIRLEIETDSTSFADEQREQTQRQQVGQVVMSGLQTVAGMVKDAPQFVPIALQTILEALDSLRGGNKYESEIRGTVQKMVEAASAPQPPPPPPPDYEGMKIQIAQLKIENENQVAQLKLQLQSQELELKNKKIDADAMNDQMQYAIDQATLAMKEKLEATWQQIDQMRIGLSEREKMLEEQRLAFDSKMQVLEHLKQPTAPPLTINLSEKGNRMEAKKDKDGKTSYHDSPKSTKKVRRMVRGNDGLVSEIHEHEEPLN